MMLAVKEHILLCNKREVPANASSVKVEIILEKELREVAKLALSEIQRQCEKLSSHLKSIEYLELYFSMIRNESSVLHEICE